jgi:deoxyribonuclease-4
VKTWEKRLIYENIKGAVKMLIIGCHLSVSKGYAAMGEQAVSIGANTFQFFIRNPRGGNAKVPDKQDVEKLQKMIDDRKIICILAHAPYTMNLCSPGEETREYSQQMMQSDLTTMELLPGQMYNFHPGSRVGQSVEAAISQISDALNKTLTDDMHTKVLLETMAGKGSEIGGSFSELREIIDQTDMKKHLGICLDTCHIFDGGYDIVDSIDKVLTEFDKVIGLEKLCAVHLNDSKNILGSRKDRHEKLGKGNIGWKTFVSIINDNRLKGIPFYLETPNEIEGYRDEINMLKAAYSEESIG